jgi:1-deoxy-D-xylulose-5-phosphate reductoisomerase
MQRLAKLSVKEVIFPIRYALAYPDRWENEPPRPQPEELGSLDFEPLGSEKFPSVDLARDDKAMAESGPVVLNAANEVAVHAFLDGKLPFVQILPTVRETLNALEPTELASLHDALKWNSWGRKAASKRPLTLDQR